KLFCAALLILCFLGAELRTSRNVPHLDCIAAYTCYKAAVVTESYSTDRQFMAAKNLQLSARLNVPDPDCVVFSTYHTAFNKKPKIPIVFHVSTSGRQQLAVVTHREGIYVARMAIQGAQDVSVG